MDENKITSLLLQLADLDITGINVYYEGGGDSGAIEYIVYSNKPNIDFDEIMDIDVYSTQSDLQKLNSAIFSQLKDFADETILTSIEDWWNDEGGYGYLCIKIPSGEYKIFNSIYIRNTEDYEHDGDLINETLK